METYGDRLKKARKDKGLSRPQLAEMCDVSAKTIQNYESNSRTPRLDITQRIAEALGVSVDYLTNGYEPSIDELSSTEKANILSQASALFAGGKLSEDEQLTFINELQTLYLEAKKINSEKN